MILPTKHISSSYSLLGIGALLLDFLERPTTVTALWERVRELPNIGTYERFSLALDFLYTIGSVEFLNGLLHKVKK